MRKLTVAVAVLFATFQAGASDPGPLIQPPPELLGTWSWTLPDGSCTETHTYEPDGSRLVTSGKEELTGSYTVRRTSDPRFLELLVKTNTDNKGQDCGGDSADDSGKSFNIFVTLVRGGQLLFCFEPNLNECYGPFRKRNAA